MMVVMYAHTLIVPFIWIANTRRGFSITTRPNTATFASLDRKFCKLHSSFKSG